LVEKAIGVWASPETPAVRLPHDNIVVDGQVVVKGVIAASMLVDGEARVGSVTV
jgi:hypothetical protein